MATKPGIYVDAGPLIDAVKFEVGALQTDRQADAWYLKQLMRAHAAGDLILYTSILSAAECVSIEQGQTKVPAAIQDNFRRLITAGQFVRLVSPTPMTATLCQDLRWKHELNIKGADALHIASAQEMKCLEFITTDDRLKTRMEPVAKSLAPALRLITARDTGLLPASYLQQTMEGLSSGSETKN